MAKYHRILSIDPAIRDLGWSIVDFYPEQTQRLKHQTSGCFSQQLGKGHTAEAIDAVTSFLYTQLSHYRPTDYVIEEPQIFASAKGLAALHSGSVLKLTAVVWACRQMIMDYTGQTPYLAKVSVWKGNQPKLVTQRRVIRDVGVSFEDHNQMDAIGLARWYALRRLQKPV